MLKAVLISLAAGGVVTSLFEYFLRYNLVDLVVEGYKKVIGFFKGEEAKVKNEFKKL